MNREDANRQRWKLGRQANAAQARVDKKEAEVTEAKKERDALFAQLHGPQHNGHLSYADLVDWSGLSRSRVIQIVRESRNGKK